ncbi:MAG: fibronectin type III domain-containing protein [Candidatus Eisenbacteria bacterium]|nr:fibronectin type III domain-containing protein [Candidatus Eisenbacteria bacterium]
MKNAILLPALLIAGLAVAGCDERHWVAPAAPRGVYSVTGDGKVSVYWQANTEKDVRGYNVYWAPGSSKGTGPYKKLGFTSHTQWMDTDVSNGVTYYYAVTAVNDGGMESELSAANVHDTPRPAGANLPLYNAWYDETRGGDYSSKSGLRFDTQPQLLSWRNLKCDVYYYGAPGNPYLYAGDVDTQIQDMGPAASLADIDFAPLDGWSATGKVTVTRGHAYVVWTRDNHYAMVIVKDLTDDRVLMDWAFQVDQGNRELKPVSPRAGDRAATSVK